MKQTTIEKIMKIYGWFTLVILVLGIPAQFVNKYLLNMEFEPLVLIMYVISSVFEMFLAIAFIRCKKDLFLVIAMAGQVLYRLIVIIINFSSVSVLAFINLAVYISLLLFVVVNCVPKFLAYRVRLNKLWFAPIIVMLVVFIVGFIKDLNEKLPSAVVNNVQNAGTETLVQSFSLGIGASSSVLGILPYLLLSYWLYKSHKIES